MNSAFFGLIAALGWGVHDFLAGITSRGIGQLRTTVAVTLFGLAALSLWLVWQWHFPAFEFPSAPIALVSTSNSVLVVNPSLNVANLSELVALLKSKPGALNYASAGSGNMTPHIDALSGKLRLHPAHAG